MTRWALVGAVVLLAGCVDRNHPFEPAGGCTVSGFATVFVEDDRECSCIAGQIHFARDLVTSAGLGTEADFEDVVIWIHASSSRMEATHEGGNHPWGRTMADGAGYTVELERFARSTAHELIHVANMRAGSTEAEEAAHSRWTDAMHTLTNVGWSHADPRYSNTACY
jgi:hypothetical protein